MRHMTYGPTDKDIHEQSAAFSCWPSGRPIKAVHITAGYTKSRPPSLLVCSSDTTENVRIFRYLVAVGLLVHV